MKHSEFNFTFFDTKFYGQYWEAANTKAVIVLAHGMGEHSGRFAHIAKKMTQNDFSVVAFDHFGHGKTEGKRGHNPNFDAVLESIQKTIEKAANLFPEKPIFLYGHSMGGNVVINFVLRKNHNLKGVIATSPFLKLAFKPPKIKLFAGKILQHIAPSITMGNELNPNDISRDPIAIKNYKNDALIHNQISPNFSITFIESGKWAIENASKLSIPMWIAHGTKDKIIDYRGSKAFVENSKKATLKLYKGGYHELQHDLCKDELKQDVIDWLNSQL